jgi:hypothetical protein
MRYVAFADVTTQGELAAMNILSSIVVLSLVFSAAPPFFSQEQGGTLGSIVMRIIKEKEPEWVLVHTCINGCGGMRSPNEEEDGATFEWRSKGHRASVDTYKLKAEGNAKEVFNVATMTPVMREGYKPNREGEALKALVDAVEFYKNKSRNGYVESYDATFRKGKTVVIVRAWAAGVAQRFALHIAQSLVAT